MRLLSFKIPEECREAGNDFCSLIDILPVSTMLILFSYNPLFAATFLQMYKCCLGH